VRHTIVVGDEEERGVGVPRHAVESVAENETHATTVDQHRLGVALSGGRQLDAAGLENAVRERDGVARLGDELRGQDTSGAGKGGEQQQAAEKESNEG